jgi:hypothetical protein
MLAADTKCAVHVELPAIAACARCGAFFCLTCQVPAAKPLCAACKERLELPEAARFRPFDVGRSLNAGFSLLSGTWLKLIWLSLPFGIGNGLIGAVLTPDFRGGLKNGDLAGIYGALLVQSLYSAVIGLIASLAALSILVGRAEGREVTVERAFKEALATWPRAVKAQLMMWMQIIGYSLLCGFPGIWRAITLAFVNEGAFLKTEGSPLDESESLVKAHFWPVFGFVMIVGMMTLGPAAGFNGVLGAAMKVANEPRQIALFVGGITGQIGRALMVPFLLSGYYGLLALSGQPAPVKKASP